MHPDWCVDTRADVRTVTTHVPRQRLESSCRGGSSGDRYTCTASRPSREKKESRKFIFKLSFVIMRTGRGRSTTHQVYRRVHVRICADTCTDVRANMCIDMCAHMRATVCTEMCMDMGMQRDILGRTRTDRPRLFLATFRRMPTANAERLDRIGGSHRKGLGEMRL